MSIPVKYGDISRESNDLFTKDFPTDLKADLKSTQNLGTFTLKASANPETQAIQNTEFAVEVKDIVKGLTFSQSISSASTLGTTLKWSNPASISGLVAKADVKYPVDLSETAKKDGKLTLEYVAPKFVTGSTYDHYKSTVTNELVTAYKGFILGTQFGFNTRNLELNKYEGTVGYAFGKYAGAVAVTDKLNTVTGWLFTAFAPKVDIGMQAKFDTKKNVTTADLALKYYYNADTVFKGKVDQDLKLGLSLTQVINKNTKLTFATLTDVRRSDKLVHKVGANASISL